MKLLIAFAAVLSSAALTIPTLIDVGGSRSDGARQMASIQAESANQNV